MPVAPARADRQADRVEASVLHAVRGVLGRRLSGPRALPWAVLAGAAVLAAVDPAATGTLAPWPFVVALAIFGMPHGAADWEVSARLAGRHGFVRRCVGFVPYMALMLACTAALVLAPGLTAVAFLGLTVVHFGMEDADSLHAAHEGRASRWSLAVGRGLILVCGVFAAHPDEAWAPFAEIGKALAPWSAVRWTIDPPAMRGAALLGCGAGVALSLLGAGARAFHGQRREAMLDIAEGALVAFVALQADPLFAIGTYFISVHAFRHCRRMANMPTIIEPPPAPPGFAQRLLRVHVLGLPLAMPTALCLAGICVLLGGFDVRTIAVASIGFYIVSTLPHHLLGLALPAEHVPHGYQSSAAACAAPCNAATIHAPGD